MAISRAQLVKELEPGLNALFGLEYKRYENQHAEIYTTESSDRAFEEEVMLSGFANADAAQAEMGKTLGLTVSANGAASANSGSTLSGQSNAQLTVGTASNAVANQWRLLRSAEDPENEDLITTPQTDPALANFSGYATVVVVANQSQWFGSGQVSA